MTVLPSSHVVFSHPSVGISPVGFQRLHVEMLPREIGRVVGYDPRALIMKPARTGARGTRDLTPHNVAPMITELQNRVQRSIDARRVAGMVDYLIAAMERGAFADWGAIELVTAAVPDMSRFDAEHVVRMDADADYFIADGQHRYCALLDFIRERPSYGDRFTQEITVSVLPAQQLAEWAGQEFHDRNYFPVLVRPGKALSVDAREGFTQLTKSLYAHPVIMTAGGIAEDKDTILAGDPRFTSLSVLHRFVRAFVMGRPGLDAKADVRADVPEEQRDRLWDYFARLGEAMPWNAATPERGEYLTRTSVMLSGLAVLGYDLYNADGVTEDRRADAVRRLGKIDWRRENLALVGVLGGERIIAANEEKGTPELHVVAPASSRQMIDAAIRYLREVSGVQSKTTESRPTPSKG